MGSIIEFLESIKNTTGLMTLYKHRQPIELNHEKAETVTYTYPLV